MTLTAVALSPHLDDAAFSCGGTLATLVREGWHVIVATLFTRSVPDPQGFALACQLDKGLAPDVDYMALRRSEDFEAMRALGVAQPVHMDWPEAPHRGYHSAKALFEPPLETDVIVPVLRAAVDNLLALWSPDLLLAPQAIGGHVDHVQVVRALGGIDRPTLWWRDYPYTIRQDVPRRPFDERFGAMPTRSFILHAAALRAREEACAAYRSQLSYQFGGVNALRARLAEAGPIERFSGHADLSLTS